MKSKHNAKRIADNAARNITNEITGLEEISFQRLTAKEKRLKKRADRKKDHFGAPTKKFEPKYCTYTDVFDELVE